MRRPTAVAVAFTLALVSAVGVAGCGGAERPQVQGPAPTASPANGPVYASDTMGRPLVRPANFPYSEFAGLTHMKWRNWGQPKAVGTGELTASFCSPKCDYPTATIELTRLERHENVSYYTLATLRSPKLDPEDAIDVGRVHLYVPEP